MLSRDFGDYRNLAVLRGGADLEQFLVWISVRYSVMGGLDPPIHLSTPTAETLDGRVEPGHDGGLAVGNFKPNQI